MVNNQLKKKKRELLQILLLVMTAVMPWVIDFSGVVTRAIKGGVSVNLQEYMYFTSGKIIASCALVLIVLFFFLRKSNCKYVFNESGNNYYNYSYGWYWFCSKILGYKNCNLKRVPISMQFKLLIRQTFCLYSYGKEEDYIIINDEKIIITTQSGNEDTVNLVLIDSYPILDEYLPGTIKEFKTIIIKRDNTGDGNRYISQEFCSETQRIVYQLVQSGCKTINVFPTTNAPHNIIIVHNAFMKGGRDDVEHLFVFPQPNPSIGDWHFSEKGVKIR